jgi:L-ascorbate metabolism protein UlaG (beta-lactamase superfamily)
MSRRTDHFDGRRFFNPNGANGQPFWKLPRVLLTPWTRWPVKVGVEPKRPPVPGSDQVVVTFIGHSTFLIQVGSVNLLTDPVYSERASPFSFAGPRETRAPGVRFDDLPAISLILLSHNHYDHCDLGTLQRLDRRFHPTVVTPLGNGRLLRSVGIGLVEEIDWWESASAAPIAITLTPAQHFSARHPFDRNRALWGGFREIATRLGPVDLALLPIGAYEPRWFMKDVHMNPAEAVQAHLDLGARQSIAMHFGRFQLTPEGIDEPIRELTKALQLQDVPVEQFRTVEVGESVWLQRE